MTAPLGNDDMPDEAPRRKWQDELDDLLKDADLPPAPGPDDVDPLTPSDAELRSAFELERRQSIVLAAWQQQMDFNFWYLRHYAITIASATARDSEVALRGLQAAANIREFIEEEIENTEPCSNDHCKHHHDVNDMTLIAKYRTVLEHVAVLNARIRALNPAAAAAFDAEDD